jgi:hypothetical protein
MQRPSGSVRYDDADIFLFKIHAFIGKRYCSLSCYIALLTIEK